MLWNQICISICICHLQSGTQVGGKSGGHGREKRERVARSQPGWGGWHAWHCFCICICTWKSLYLCLKVMHMYLCLDFFVFGSSLGWKLLPGLEGGWKTGWGERPGLWPAPNNQNMTPGATVLTFKFWPPFSRAVWKGLRVVGVSGFLYLFTNNVQTLYWSKQRSHLRRWGKPGMNLKSLLGLVSLFSSSSQGTTSFARQPTPASVILITRDDEMPWLWWWPGWLWPWERLPWWWTTLDMALIMALADGYDDEVLWPWWWPRWWTWWWPWWWLYLGLARVELAVLCG